MLLKQLEYFVCVVDNNSFTLAATEQYVSQSAISQQIKALENSLGVELMVREKRSFHLTPAGQYLYRSGKKYSGIAMQQTVIRMAKRYKNLDIRMYSGSHEELYGMLQDRRVDVAFNDQWQVLSDDYESQLIDKATTIIEVPQGYTDAGSVELKTIDDLPLILVCRGKYTLTEEDHYRKAMGYSGAFAYARTLEEARYLVAGQQGLLLLDRFKYLTDALPGIERKVLTNHGKTMERHYYFVSHRSQDNTYVEAFKDMFIQVLDEF